mmetsp:Transcript_13368/g.34161  ORF Transcript_13368/g.34161 Transcript_13368/m.34161 type:complete len:220 (-) Transcript_13368:685-1344(-)
MIRHFGRGFFVADPVENHRQLAQPNPPRGMHAAEACFHRGLAHPAIADKRLGIGLIQREHLLLDLHLEERGDGVGIELGRKIDRLARFKVVVICVHRGFHPRHPKHAFLEAFGVEIAHGGTDCGRAFPRRLHQPRDLRGGPGLDLGPELREDTVDRGDSGLQHLDAVTERAHPGNCRVDRRHVLLEFGRLTREGRGGLSTPFGEHCRRFLPKLRAEGAF